MQRAQVVLTALLVAMVAVVGGIVVSAERRQADDLDRLLCLEKVQALAGVAAMVPADKVDADARVESARQLGDQLGAC